MGVPGRSGVMVARAFGFLAMRPPSVSAIAESRERSRGVARERVSGISDQGLLFEASCVTSGRIRCTSLTIFWILNLSLQKITSVVFGSVGVQR